MTVKDLAKEFGMTAKDLCKEIGYTPQGLNRILRSDRVVYPGKFREAMCHIFALSCKIQEIEKRKTQECFESRIKILDDLAAEKGVFWRIGDKKNEGRS